ncbi:MAG TPA: hypothetical protein VIU12_02380 [Chryseolinea sp.]
MMNRLTSGWIAFCFLITLSFVQCEKKSDVNDGTEISTPQPREDTASLTLQAELYYKERNYAEAVNAYSRLIKFDSVNRLYRYRRGISYNALDSANLAIDDFESALKLGYDEFKCRFALGMLYYTLHSNKDSLARANIKRCLELKPNAPKVLNWLEYMDKLDRELYHVKKTP